MTANTYNDLSSFKIFGHCYNLASEHFKNVFFHLFNVESCSLHFSTLLRQWKGKQAVLVIKVWPFVVCNHHTPGEIMKI